MEFAQMIVLDTHIWVWWINKVFQLLEPCGQKRIASADIVLLPITPAIATRAVGLQGHHSDPQDRIIIATAIEHQAELMSDDGEFPMYSELEGRLL